MAGRQQALNSGAGLGLIDSTKDSVTGTADQPFTLYHTNQQRGIRGSLWSPNERYVGVHMPPFN